MKWIILDFGTYELKALKVNIEGAKLVIEDFKAFPSKAEYFSGLGMPKTSAWAALTISLNEIEWLDPGEEIIITSTLPSAYLETRYLKFPFKAPKKIEKVLPFELESAIPFDVNDVLLRHSILSGDGVTSRKKQNLVMAMAFKREVIKEYEEEFRKFQQGIPSFTAQILALSTLRQTITKEPIFGLLELGHSKSQFLIMQKGGTILGARTIWWGAESLVKLLVQKHGANENQAVNFVKRLSAQRALPSQIIPLVQNFANDLKQTVKSWEAEGLKMPSQLPIFTFGHLSHCQPVVSYINDAIKGEFHLELDPLPKDELLSQIEGADKIENLDSALPCIATALMQTRNHRKYIPAFSETSFQFQQNLKKIKSGSFDIIRRVALLLLAPVLFSGLYFYFQGQENDKVLERLTETLTKTGLKVSANLPPDKIVKRMQTEALSNQKKIGQMTEDLKSPLVILTDISRTVKSRFKIDVQELRVTSSLIALSAQTDSNETAEQILRALESKFGAIKKGPITACKSKKDCQSFTVEIERKAEK
jgi:hypothetical protein